MEVLEKRSLHDVQVVITDKLPDAKVVSGSAAEVLVIPNVFAWRYANYLLNGIHLCESLKELHEYPKGGLMKNGMFRRSRMRKKNMRTCRHPLVLLIQILANV